MNVVITGGSSGLGKAMAKEFCKRDHNVLITVRNYGKLKESTDYILNNGKGKCYTFQCDVQDYKQVSKLGEYASYIFDKKIDHWINNAACCEGPVDFDELTLKDISTILSTNVLGTVYGIKVAHDLDVKNIYTVSGHGSDGGQTPSFAMYGASKALISQLTSTLATELKDVNINIIAPGLMKTPLSQKLLESEEYNDVVKCLFKLLCKDPNKVARILVPKILKHKGSNNIIKGY